MKKVRFKIIGEEEFYRVAKGLAESGHIVITAVQRATLPSERELIVLVKDDQVEDYDGKL